MAPPERKAPKAGHKRALTPTREASTRRAFEVFEWDRDFEDMQPPPPTEEVAPGEEHWDTPPEPRPPVPKYSASLKEAEDLPPEVEEEVPEEEPEIVPEAEDLIDEEVLAEARELTPKEAVLVEEDVPPMARGPEEPPAPAAEAQPQVPEEVVVEGRPGHRPRAGGEFPADLMEPLDDSATEAAATLDVAQWTPAPEETPSRETDISDEIEASPEETETDESMVGLSHSHRWPSDTGLELHIDGFEHMASASDLCPRCGRRITARNRMLTCTDCGTLACEGCEMRTSAEVDAPYYYDWRFQLPLCGSCFDKAFSIQKALAKAKAALGMGNHTYAFYHAQQALRTDPKSPYAGEAEEIISQVDRRRRESAEADERWKRERAKLSRTSIVHEG
jgi:hypothetical protein